MRYDLLTEPWIAVADQAGAVEETGLKPLLLRAHELRELRDPIPTAEFGIYRLLIALVLDIYRPRHEDDLEDLLHEGRFAPEKIEEYFRKWGDRFDLFHPERPFLQSPGAGQPDQPLALLHFAIPSGTNASHFHHQHEEAFVLAPAAAARLLTTPAPFMTMGGAGYSPSVNGAPPWYVLAAGANLFETLVLNAAPSSASEGIPLGAPSWRRDGDVPVGDLKVDSLLIALTWQPRRILFEAGEGGRCSLTGRESPVLVRRMAFKKGARVESGGGHDDQAAWVNDPQVAYRRGEKGWIPLRPQEEKEVWRDTGALTQTKHVGEQGKNRAPVVLNIASVLLKDQGALRVQLYGLRTSSLDSKGKETDRKGKVFEWQREELALPIKVLWQSPVHNRLSELIRLSDQVAWTLGKAIERAYPRRGGEGVKRPFGALVAKSRGDYWRILRPKFDELLRLVVGDRDAAKEFWTKAARAAGRRCLRAALDPLDSDWRALQRAVNAEGYFERELYKLLNPNSTERTGKKMAAASTGEKND